MLSYFRFEVTNNYLRKYIVLFYTYDIHSRIYLNVLHLDIWWGITSLIGIQGVVMPIVFTVFNKSFRHYCWRQIKNDINDVFCYIHTFTSVVKQHNAQVSSLQQLRSLRLRQPKFEDEKIVENFCRFNCNGKQKINYSYIQL